MKRQNNKVKYSIHKNSLSKGIGVFAAMLVLASVFSTAAFALEEAPPDSSSSLPAIQDSSMVVSSISESAPPSSTESWVQSSSHSQNASSLPIQSSFPQSSSIQSGSTVSVSSSTSSASNPSSSSSALSSSSAVTQEEESSSLVPESIIEANMLDSLSWAEGDPVMDFQGLEQAITAFNSSDHDMTVTIGQDIVLDSSLTIGPNTHTLTFTSAVADAPYSLFVARDIRHFTLQNSTVDFGNVALTRAPSYRNFYQYGGGLVIKGTSNMLGGSITNNIVYNEARKEGLGGGIYLSTYSVFNLLGGNISGNKAYQGAGGGVFADVGSIFTMSGGSITNNFARNGAGAFALGSTINMYGSAAISGNTADLGDGGGIFLMHNYPNSQLASLTMGENAVVSGNTSISDIPLGGGILSNGGTIVIKDNASVVNNSVKDHPTLGKGGAGGGIYIKGDARGKLTLSGNSKVNNNTVESSIGAVSGGGIAAGYQNSVTINNGASVSNNSVYGLTSMGGGISGHFITLNNATILNNKAGGTNGGRGGGVWSYETLTINASTISENSANTGGGIDGYTILLDTSKIAKNKASGNGGGIYIRNSITLGSNEILSNQAGGNGGGLSIISYANLTLKTGAALTFSGNTASSLYQPTSLPNSLGSWQGTISTISPDFTGDKTIQVFNNFDIKYTEGTLVPFYSVIYHSIGATSGTAPVDTGGTAIPGSNQYLPGSTAAIIGNTGNLAQNGYTFAGWAEAPSQSVPQYQEGALLTNLQGDIALYPVWQATTYTIQYNLSGGVPASIQPDQYLASTLPLAIGNPSKQGYNFTGWTSDVPQLFPQPVKDAVIPSDTYGNISLLANWSAKGGFTVQYNTSGGNPQSLAPKTDLYWDSSNLLPVQSPAKEGASFLGWFITSGGTETLVENTHQYGSLAADDTTTTLTLSAKWQPLSYKVSFVGWDDSLLKAQQVFYGKNATAPTPPQRQGYTFSGWDIDFSQVKSDLKVTAQYTLLPETPSSSASSNSIPSNTSAVSSSSAASSSTSSSTVAVAPSGSSSTPPSSVVASPSRVNSSSSNPASSSSEALALPSSSHSSGQVHAGLSGQHTASDIPSQPATTGSSAPATETPKITEKLQAQQGHGILENIFSGNIPLFGFTAPNTQSLFSLLFGIVGIISLAVVGTNWLLQYKQNKNNLLNTNQSFSGMGITILRWAAILTSLLPFLLFFMLEDLSQPLVYINQSTPVIFILLLVHLSLIVIATVLQHKKTINTVL